ncbi:MAG: hypothetical protein ACK55I_39655, partial [bacterium]
NDIVGSKSFVIGIHIAWIPFHREIGVVIELAWFAVAYDINMMRNQDGAFFVGCMLLKILD